MFDTKVVTSYTNGTIIEMDANDALNFLVGLSITVINTVRDTIEEENEIGDKVTKSCDHDVMHLIEYYNSGIPGAIYSCILQTNADILLKFVQDIVLNETTRGLYLFYHRSRMSGAAPYDLIIKALEDVHQYYMVYGNDNYKRNKNNYYNRYNDEFMNLITEINERNHDMKVYVMSRVEDGEIQTPKVSRDISNLRKEMKAEYDKVLKDAGHLGRGYSSDNGDLVAYYGSCRYVWRIDEIIC